MECVPDHVHTSQNAVSGDFGRVRPFCPVCRLRSHVPVRPVAQLRRAITSGCPTILELECAGPHCGVRAEEFAGGGIASGWAVTRTERPECITSEGRRYDEVYESRVKRAETACARISVCEARCGHHAVAIFTRT